MSTIEKVPLERKLYAGAPPEVRTLAPGSGSVNPGKLTIVGFGLPYNEPSLGGHGEFCDVFEPNCFTNLADRSGRDIKCFLNHDQSKLLGRVRNGSFNVEDKPVGLFYELHPPSTTLGKDVVEAVRSGLLDGASVGFFARKCVWPAGKRWEGLPVRVIKSAELFEISIVTEPAYLETTAKLDVKTLARLELSRLQDETSRLRHARLRLAARHQTAALRAWLAQDER